ncbi:MAG: glucose-6-phosphate isomerase [Christensenellales bacterium]
MANRIVFDFNNMIKPMIGEQGIGLGEIEQISSRSHQAALAMEQQREQMAWRDLPYTQDAVIEDILLEAEKIRHKFEAFVVLGIGGSALGPIAVQQALNHLHYNELPANQRKGPRFFVEDNIDPERMEALLDIIDPGTTMFNIITKSGGTSETMSQALIICDLLKKKGIKLSDNLIATTDRQKGNLIRIARQENLKTLYIPDGVGGRFSELCPVGLLPAAVCGIDIRGMLAGAAEMDKRCRTADVMKNPAYLGGVLQYIAMQKGRNISVMMPYADSLRTIADWYAQIWAESLGKQYDVSGNEVFSGQTPVKALGVTDQHSQMQLYTEGPFDKTVTLLGVENYRNHVDIPHGFEDIPDVAFLGGHSLNELIRSEQFASEYALTKAGRMNCTITLETINAHTIGQLLYYFEVQTAFTGQLLGIDAFNQPGVEEGKNATYALLGKRGFDDKRRELSLRPAKDAQWIL